MSFLTTIDWGSVSIGVITFFGGFLTYLQKRNEKQSVANSVKLDGISLQVDGRMSEIIEENRILQVTAGQQNEKIAAMNMEIIRISERLNRLPEHIEAAIVETAKVARIVKHDVSGVQQTLESGAKVVVPMVTKLIEKLADAKPNGNGGKDAVHNMNTSDEDR